MEERKGLQHGPSVSPGSSLPNKGMRKKALGPALAVSSCSPRFCCSRSSRISGRQAPKICSFHKECRTHTLCSPLFPPSAQRTRRGFNQLSRAAASLKGKQQQLWLCGSGILGSSPVPQSHLNPSSHPPSSQKGRSNQLQRGELQTKRKGQIFPAIPPTIA